MKSTAHEHLCNIFTHSHSSLSRIFEAYRVNEQLRLQFAQDVPQEWQVHLDFILYRAGILTVQTKSTAMRMRIQYEKSQLIAHLRQQKTWVGLKDIKIQVSC